MLVIYPYFYHYYIPKNYKYCVVGTSIAKHDIQVGKKIFFLEKKVFFMSQHGTILGLFSSKMYHGTKRNIRGTQVGVALIAKAKVAFGGAKKQKTLEESWP
jgi:hypothetical protein